MEKEDNRILLLEKGKRKLIQIVFGRTGIIIVSLIVQILFLFAGFRYLEGFLPYFWGGSSLLSAADVVFHSRHFARLWFDPVYLHQNRPWPPADDPPLQRHPGADGRPRPLC